MEQTQTAKKRGPKPKHVPLAPRGRGVAARASASFTLTGAEHIKKLNAAAARHGQKVGEYARDLALAHLDEDSPAAQLAVVRAELAEIKALVRLFAAQASLRR